MDLRSGALVTRCCLSRPGVRATDELGVSLAIGLALLAMVYVIGPVSGCHIYPAVTLGLVLSRKIELRAAIGSAVAQVVGMTLRPVEGDTWTMGAAETVLGDFAPADADYDDVQVPLGHERCGQPDRAPGLR